MFLKWIVCTVSPENRELFSEAQSKWSDLREVPGFLGQLGGWNANDPAQACILALWQDEQAYQAFMEHHHDPIYEKTGQRGTFDRIQVTSGESILAISGAHEAIERSLAQAALLRVADQQLRDGHAQRFLTKQEEIWNPGMQQAGGLLSGVVGESAADPNRLLVATLWESDAAHRSYCDRTLPGLRERARIEENIEQLAGYVVRLEPNWLLA